jgi:hypothetical protein
VVLLSTILNSFEDEKWSDEKIIKGKGRIGY